MAHAHDWSAHRTWLKLILKHSTFCMGRDPIVQVRHGEANFIFPLCNPSEYSRPVPLHHQYAQCLGEGNHTYSLVGQSTDKKKLRRRLPCCIHDRLAFDDVAAH